MSTCKDCGFNIRGKNHDKGTHHKNSKPTATKTQKKLWGRQNDFEREKARLGNQFTGQISMPGSLQVGKCR